MLHTFACLHLFLLGGGRGTALPLPSFPTFPLCPLCHTCWDSPVSPPHIFALPLPGALFAFPSINALFRYLPGSTFPQVGMPSHYFPMPPHTWTTVLVPCPVPLPCTYYCWECSSCLVSSSTRRCRGACNPCLPPLPLTPVLPFATDPPSPFFLPPYTIPHCLHSCHCAFPLPFPSLLVWIFCRLHTVAFEFTLSHCHCQHLLSWPRCSCCLPPFACPCNSTFYSLPLAPSPSTHIPITACLPALILPLGCCAVGGGCVCFLQPMPFMPGISDALFPCPPAPHLYTVEAGLIPCPLVIPPLCVGLWGGWNTLLDACSLPSCWGGCAHGTVPAFAVCVPSLPIPAHPHPAPLPTRPTPHYSPLCSGTAFSLPHAFSTPLYPTPWRTPMPVPFVSHQDCLGFMPIPIISTVGLYLPAFSTFTPTTFPYTLPPACASYASTTTNLGGCLLHTFLPSTCAVSYILGVLGWLCCPGQSFPTTLPSPFLPALALPLTPYNFPLQIPTYPMSSFCQLRPSCLPLPAVVCCCLPPLLFVAVRCLVCACLTLPSLLVYPLPCRPHAGQAPLCLPLLTFPFAIPWWCGVSLVFFLPPHTHLFSLACCLFTLALAPSPLPAPAAMPTPACFMPLRYALVVLLHIFPPIPCVVWEFACCLPSFPCICHVLLPVYTHWYLVRDPEWYLYLLLGFGRGLPHPSMPSQWPCAVPSSSY